MYNSYASFLAEDVADAGRGKVAQFHADHVLIDFDLVVGAAVVDLELQAHKRGQDGARASVGADGLLLLARLLEGKRHDVRHLPH